jgi:hypothetical protein
MNTDKRGWEPEELDWACVHRQCYFAHPLPEAQRVRHPALVDQLNSELSVWYYPAGF